MEKAEGEEADELIGEFDRVLQEKTASLNELMENFSQFSKSIENEKKLTAKIMSMRKY